MELTIAYMPISALKPYEKNTRKHEALDVDNIARSIERYGMNDPIGIWGEDNVIVEGHGRLMACRKLGIDTVPVVRLDHLTDEQRREYAIAHNATAELSEWDRDLLAEELCDLDLSDFDFEFDIARKDEIVEDKAPEVDKESEPTAKLGDIWQLGRHRLMCGNCGNEQERAKLLGDSSIELVYTDPPYDMDMGGGGCFASTMENTKKELQKLIHFDVYSLEWLAELPAGAYYVWTSKQGVPKYFDVFLAKSTGFHILTWTKTNPTPLTHGTFLPDMEYCMYFQKKNRVWNNGLKPTEIYKRWYQSKKETRLEDGGDDHPTIKPVDMVADKIQISSTKGGNVFDPFGGSGTTLIACEQTGRRCFMMEVEPKYCDVIIRRWENFTGEKAVLLNGETAQGDRQKAV